MMSLPVRHALAALALLPCLAVMPACGESGSPNVPATAPATAPAAEPATATGATSRDADRSPAPDTGSADPRVAVSLDGEWDLLLDPENAGRDAGWQNGGHGAWERALTVAVPGPFELLPETSGYDGVVWYRTPLPPAPTLPDGGGVLQLAFDGANDRADVWLGGRHLGRHDGSDIPFRFTLEREALPPDAALVVRIVDPGDTPVDGLRLGARPHAKESWYVNYGGLTGSVRLLAVPPVELLRHTTTLPAEGGGASIMALTLQNHTDAPRPVSVTLSFAPPGIEPGTDPNLILETSLDRSLAPGETTLTFPVLIDTTPRWSPQTPVLATVAVTIADGTRRDRWLRRYGLRRFAVNGSHFELNGEPLYLKGVLFQPYWPRTLSHPPTPDFLRRELQAIKDAGFNLVRAHIRTLPLLYEACDEIGLLVHAEPTLGWITHFDATTRPAVDAAIEQLARDVAGHPSVVMVGLLNELSGEIHRGRTELMQQAHALMPQMLLLEDSGSWTGTSHYWNPGAAAPVPFDDLHIYRAWPWDDGDLRYVRSLGEDHDRLVFVSEYGYGGIARLFANVRGFGDELWLEDAQEHVRQLEEARAGIAPTDRLAILFRGEPDERLRALIDIGLENQAAAARYMTSAIRSNARVAGDVYTQWRDVMWEDGAGLVDVWGTPKPALDVMRALNESDDRPSDPSEEVRPLGPFARNTWGQTPAAGKMGLLDAIALDDETREALRSSLFFDEAAYQERLIEVRHDLQLPGGALEEPDDADEFDVVSAGHLVNFMYPRLAVVGRRGAWWSPSEIETTLSLLRWVHAGGTAILLAPPDAGRPQDVDFFGYASFGTVADLPFEAHMRSARGHFVGTHMILDREMAGFVGFYAEEPLVPLGPRLSALRPDHVLDVRGFDGTMSRADCFDGYGRPVGSALQAVFFGEGILLLNTLPLDDLTPEELERALQAIVVSALDPTYWILPMMDAEENQGYPTPPPPRPPVTVPAEYKQRIGELIWQHKNYFGLAERLAYQNFNGSRPVRRELDDLQAVIDNKNAGLADIIAGDYEQGIARLERIEDGPLGGEREAFARTELRVTTKYADWGGRPELPVRLRIGELHGKALVAMRDGDLPRAIRLLETAERVIENLPPWTGPRRGDRDGDGIPDEDDPDFVGDEGDDDSTGQGLPGDR